MTQKIVKCETSELTARIFGSFDSNVNAVEKAFGVKIQNRSAESGDAILISGEEENAALATKVIEYLKGVATINETIEEQSVRYVIDMVKGGEADSLESLDGDCVCITQRGKPIKAKTVGQKQYIKAIEKNTIVLGVGPAGTGKTYLAVCMAVAAFKSRQVEKIILTRPAVEAGEKLGFLPGDLHEKVDPYLRPLYDALQELLGLETYVKLMERGAIEVAPLAYMRGRTLSNAFIILDEAQNTTKEQMKMFLTRMGEGSKMVVTGDVTQIDLDGKDSGLVHATKVLENVEGISVCKLTAKDVVRHPLVMRIIRAYEKDAEAKEKTKKTAEDKSRKE